MNPREAIVDFLSSQALVWLPMLLGHQARRRGWIDDRVARPLHTLNLVALTPLVLGLGMWKLDRSNSDWLRVPAIYGAMLVASGVIAFTLSPRLFRNRKSVGTHIMLVPISNIAHTLAGFLTLLLIGVEAYPLNTILMLPSSICIYLIWFPAAVWWGRGGGEMFGPEYWQTVFSPLSLPLVGIFAGLAVNMTGLPMAAGWVKLMQWAVFIATALTMFAIGSRLRFRHALRFLPSLRWLCAIKFIAHPAIAMALCWAIGLRGMPAAVLLIGSIMPAGVMPIQLATIEELDVDLANAGFLISTMVFMLAVLPAMILLLRLPMFQA